MIALLAFTRSPLGRAAMILLGLIVLIGVLWSCVAKRDREMIERANDEANVAAAKVQAETREQAAEERVADDRASRQTEKELTDAVAPVPDSAPDAARIALGCQRLRRAGARDAGLPGPCRPEGGVQASARP